MYKFCEDSQKNAQMCVCTSATLRSYGILSPKGDLISPIRHDICISLCVQNNKKKLSFLVYTGSVKYSYFCLPNIYKQKKIVSICIPQNMLSNYTHIHDCQ